MGEEDRRGERGEGRGEGRGEVRTHSPVDIA